MTWFSNMPINRKLTIVILMTGTAVLMLAGVAMIATESVTSRREMKENLVVRADLLGRFSTAPLSFHRDEDADEVRRTLSALEADSHIVIACLYDKNQHRFGDYARAGAVRDFPDRPPPDGARFAADYLEVSRPVNLDQKRIGTLYLRADLKRISSLIEMHAAIVGLVLLLTIGVSLVVAPSLRRPISEPILALADLARRVAEKKDYAARAVKRGQDEVGLLTDAFNQMLNEIEMGHRSLQEANASMSERTREVEEMSSRLALATRAANVGIWDWDVVHNKLTWDETMYMLYDVRPDEFSGALESWEARLHPDDKSRAVNELQAALQGGDEFAAEFRLVLPDETVRHIKANSVTFRDDAGKAIRMLGTNWDITSRVQAESLRVAKRAADAANQTKSDFLATISHELRTPLNGIIGMNELLLRTELNAQQRKYVDACSGSGKLLMQLINDILDLSKIEAGKLELDPRECDMEALIYDVAEMMLPAARQKGLSLRCRLASDVCVIAVCDDNRLRQVLVNLVNNAVKFTSTGSVTINGTRMTQQDGSTWMRVSVVDTGIGIPAERRGQLFQVFSQVDSSTTRHFGGTGLGLAICRQLVELMGGTIGVESEAKAGSTFWFEIPMEIAGENAGWQRKRRLLTGVRFIAIDPPDRERSQITDCLRSWRCPFEQVATYPEALAAVIRAREAQTPFKLVLADGGLVTGDDYTILQQLTSIPDLHVIGLGDPSDEESTNYFRSLGVRHVLSDPIRPSALLNAISSVLAVACGKEAQEVGYSTLLPVAPVTISGHVLVAEDHRINQLFIVDLLKDFGCTVDLVSNGRDAVAAVEGRRYSLVLMDCQMPEMDGFAATREIRKREAAGLLPGRVPIVALTANAFKGDRDRCLGAGMDDYLSKPVEADHLHALLQKLLGRPEAAPSTVVAKAG